MTHSVDVVASYLLIRILNTSVLSQPIVLLPNRWICTPCGKYTWDFLLCSDALLCVSCKMLL